MIWVVSIYALLMTFAWRMRCKKHARLVLEVIRLRLIVGNAEKALLEIMEIEEAETESAVILTDAGLARRLGLDIKSPLR